MCGVCACVCVCVCGVCAQCVCGVCACVCVCVCVVCAHVCDITIHITANSLSNTQLDTALLL